MSYDHNQSERLRPFDHSLGDPRALQFPQNAADSNNAPSAGGGRCSYAPPPPPFYYETPYLTAEEAEAAIEKDDVGSRAQLISTRKILVDASTQDHRERNRQLMFDKQAVPDELARTMRAQPESPARPWDVTDDFHEFEPSEISPGETIARMGLIGPQGMIRQSGIGGTETFSTSSGSKKGGFFSSSRKSGRRLRLFRNSSSNKSTLTRSKSSGLTGRNLSPPFHPSAGDEYDNRIRNDKVGNVTECVEPGVPFGAVNDERSRLRWLSPGEVRFHNRENLICSTRRPHCITHVPLPSGSTPSMFPCTCTNALRFEVCFITNERLKIVLTDQTFSDASLCTMTSVTVFEMSRASP